MLCDLASGRLLTICSDNRTKTWWRYECVFLSVWVDLPKCEQRGVTLWFFSERVCRIVFNNSFLFGDVFVFFLEFVLYLEHRAEGAGRWFSNEAWR